MKSLGLLLLSLAILVAVPSGLNAAIGTAFTYQGQLRDSGLPAGGTYTLQFKLFDAATGGVQTGPTLTLPGVVVTNGQFAVQLDFGTYTAGSPRWLEITVNGTVLSPRQELKPVPNSMYASTAGVATAAAANSITSSMLSSDGNSLNKVSAAMMNVNGGRIGIGTVAPFGRLDITESTAGELAIYLHNSNTAGSERLYFDTDSNGAGMTVWGTTNATNPGRWRSFNNRTGGSFDWVTAGAVRMTLTNAGGLGVGTATPEESLSVYNSLKVDQANTNDGTPDIKFGGGATGEGIGSKRTSGGNQNGLDFFTNSTSRLNVANDGTVGVTAKLYVNHGHAADDTKPSLVLGNAGSGEGINSTRWAGDNANGIDFYTGNTKKMSITSGGNVGIGTSNPAVKLEVAGNVRIQDGTALGLSFSGNGEVGADTGIGHPSDGMLTFWNNGGEAMCIKTGNVGIGTLTPTSKLQVRGGDLTFEDQTDTARSIKNAYDIILSVDADSDSADAWFRVLNGTIEQLRIDDGDEAAIRGDGTFMSNGIDFAEAFKVAEADLEPGDVVSLAIGRPEYCRRSTAACDQVLLGVISRKPSFLAGASFQQEAAADPELAARRVQARLDGDVRAEKQLTAQLAEVARQTYRPVALLGRVPCKVVGSIKAGDYVTSSDTPGHAMRQVQAGPTLGIALEDAAGPGPSRIMVFVRPGWYGGAATVADPAPAQQLQQQDPQVSELAARVVALEKLLEQSAASRGGSGQ